MPIYTFQDPSSGIEIDVEGEGQPTDADLEPLFREAYQQKAEQLAKKSSRIGVVENLAKGLVPTEWPGIVKENIYDPLARRVRGAVGLGDVPISTPEETARGIATPVAETLGLGLQGTGRLVGATTAAVGLVEGLPSAAPLMAIGGLGPAASRAVGSIFAAPMVTGSFDQFKAASEAEAAGKVQEASNLRTQGALSLLMGLGIPAGVPLGKALETRAEFRNVLKDRGLPEAEQVRIEDQIIKAQDIALDATIPNSAIIVRRPARIIDQPEPANISISEAKEQYWRGVRENPEGGKLGFQRTAEETTPIVPDKTRQALERERAAESDIANELVTLEKIKPNTEAERIQAEARLSSLASDYVSARNRRWAESGIYEVPTTDRTFTIVDELIGRAKFAGDYAEKAVDIIKPPAPGTKITELSPTESRKTFGGKVSFAAEAPTLLRTVQNPPPVPRPLGDVTLLQRSRAMDEKLSSESPLPAEPTLVETTEVRILRNIGFSDSEIISMTPNERSMKSRAKPLSDLDRRIMQLEGDLLASEHEKGLDRGSGFLDLMRDTARRTGLTDEQYAQSLEDAIGKRTAIDITAEQPPRPSVEAPARPQPAVAETTAEQVTATERGGAPSPPVAEPISTTEVISQEKQTTKGVVSGEDWQKTGTITRNKNGEYELVDEGELWDTSTDFAELMGRYHESNSGYNISIRQTGKDSWDLYFSKQPEGESPVLELLSGGKQQTIGEQYAIQEQGANALPVRTAPEGGETVGGQVRRTEEPAGTQQQAAAEVQPISAKEAEVAPTEPAPEAPPATRFNQQALDMLALKHDLTLQQAGLALDAFKKLGEQSNAESFQKEYLRLALPSDIPKEVGLGKIAGLKGARDVLNDLREVSAGLKAFSVSEKEISGLTTRSGPPPAKAEKGTRETEFQSLSPAPAPSAPPQTAGSKSAASPPSSAGIGIVPPVVAKINQLLQPVYEYLRKDHPTGPLDAIDIDKNPLPALASQDFYKRNVTRPSGGGIVPIFGRLHDPRYKGSDPINSAFIVHAFQSKIGEGIASAIGARLRYADDAFKVDPETGKVTNVNLRTGQSPYLEDIAREFYKNPRNFDLSPEQVRALVEARELNDRLLNLMAEEGIPKAEAIRMLAEDEAYADQPNSYFPRPVIKFPSQDRQGGTGGMSRNPAQLKKRSFKSEAAGAGAGYVYEPLFSNRIATNVQRAYRAIAANRLSKDPALQGQTIRERLESSLEQSFPELAFLKDRIDNASSEGIKKMFMDRYQDVFEDLREDYPDTFRDLRDAAASVTSREGVVEHPLFRGRVFDKATANALRERLTNVPHKIIDKATWITRQSNALMLALDWSAPWVQGQPLLWYSIVNRNNVWGRALADSARSWFNPDYMRRAMEKPEYQQLANELAQLGVSLGKLQDYMAGAAKGQFSTRLPVIGKGFERAGAAFGAFMDIAKLEWWKALREVTPKEQWLKAAEMMENLLGSGRMDVVGLHPQIRQASEIAWRAASYYRSGVNVIAGLVEKGASGDLARKTIGAMTGGITASFVGAALAAGMSWDDIYEKLKRLDFTVPITLPNGKRMNVGFSHVILSLAKLPVRIAAHVMDGKRIDEGGADENPILKFLYGHAGMIPQLAMETVLGRDFLGQPTTGIRSVVKQFTPLPAQQIGQTLQREGPVSAIGDALPTVIGMNAYPENYRQLVRDRLNKEAQKQTGKDYDKLNLIQQSRVVRVVDRLKEVVEKPESTISEIVRGRKFTEKLRNDLIDSLSPDTKKIINRLGLSVSGFDPEVNIAGTSVRLDEKRRNALMKLVATEYDKTIQRLGKSTSFGKLPPLEKKKALDKQLLNAKNKAKDLLIRQDKLGKSEK